ncbi:MAG: [FeFe] hydrogenase H-cluster maturation GTPase HydF [Lachnospiraceae bacterium]|nr:[FeFe] hydrogenase H-cluster maturation GTPase HydF [Lachnospiraceae bacterium]
MSMNLTPSGERMHISFFGCRNAGKSSLVNAFCSQKVSIVSDVLGTTTDPVGKSMELLPLGPVVITDTPGIDDEGALGNERIKRTREILRKTDIAILVVDGTKGKSASDEALISLFNERDLPYIIALNKADLSGKDISDNILTDDDYKSGLILNVSAANGFNIDLLKEITARLTLREQKENSIIGDIVTEGDTIILVVPIDKAAPKGRLILPQQQVIRDALDHGVMPLVSRDSELKKALSALSAPPSLVITDSQVFKTVSRIIPDDIPLTSFSILMARYKGNLTPSVNGVFAIDSLEDDDCILISEGCSHHRQCGDIGSVKLPALLKKYTGKNLNIRLSSGQEYPEDLSEFKLIIHCGACMLNPAEANFRYKKAEAAGVPITNYGIAISYMNGILKRCINMLPEFKNV